MRQDAVSTRKRRLTDQYLTLDDLHQRERVLKQAAQLVFSHAFVEETVLWRAVRASGPDGEELTTAAVIFHSGTGARNPQTSPPAMPRPQRAHGHAHVAGHCTGRASG
ncbi:protein of unknown function [Streptantibioticus cattleyicolor NRRL 8057 = DSM 46488]|nr:protein of unknown function [Streptantibioticus cattleyicolor NRRL 8057 = DSM 46488]